MRSPSPPQVAGPATGRTLPVIDIDGIGRAAGRAYGEACRALARRHLEEALDRLAVRTGIGADDALRLASPYRDATRAVEPELAAEVDGLEEGAALPIGGGWVLQLRAELLFTSAVGLECTSFAACGVATADGSTIAGLNADLPAFYGELLVLLRRSAAGKPRVLTLTPAGQLGHHGMNEHGVTVLANFLHSGGWRLGVPRYLLTRIALARRSRAAAVEAAIDTPLASPRNLLIADDAGATDLELGTSQHARIETRSGLIAHTNHHLAPAMTAGDRAPEAERRNSVVRLERLEQLLAGASGRIDVEGAARILRDRAGAPDAISSVRGEWPADFATVASTIAEVAARRLWIALGPPHLTTYQPYSV